MTPETCDLLLKAQSLASERGLDTAKLKCPFFDICKGTTCFLFDHDEPGEEKRRVVGDLRKGRNDLKGEKTSPF
jgi:hypothetical protein